MTEGTITFLVTVVAIAIGIWLGAYSNARVNGAEKRLRPTLIINAMSGLITGLLSLFFYMYWDGVAADQIGALYGLLGGFSAAFAVWIWWFYVRRVFWNEDGIGVRTPFSTRFFSWDEVGWAGRAFDGSFVISAGRKRIRYTQFDGGYTQLNQEIKHRLPSMIKNF